MCIRDRTRMDDLDEVEASVFDRDDASAPRALEPVKIEAMKEIESENARLAPGATAAREEAFRTMMAREKMREDNRSAAVGDERGAETAGTRARALEARLVESETLRDGMRDALATLKEKYETMAMVMAGAVEARRGGFTSAEMKREVGLAKAAASEERARRYFVRISRVFGMRELAHGDAVERVVRIFTLTGVGESD